MKLVIKERKGREYDIVIFSTELLEKEFYAKHVHRKYFGINKNTCIVKFVESTRNFIGEPKEEEAFVLVEATIKSDKIHLRAGVDEIYIIPSVCPLLRCREFEWDKVTKFFMPVSKPEIGVFKISMVQIAGISELSKHKYPFLKEEIKEIRKKIDEIEYPKKEIENAKTEIKNRILTLNQIGESLKDLNKSETTEENLNRIEYLENNSKIINVEIAELKKRLDNYEKIKAAEYRLFLVNHIMPAILN